MAKRRTAIVLAGATLLAWIAAAWALRERAHPSACPFSQRLFLDLPRPFMRRETMLELLAPAPGERVLEVGAGIGYYSLPVARSLGPDGRLSALDIQPAMLDELMRRARAEEITTIEPVQGNAQVLPYPDATFDAAFLVATLGEIPARDQALRELRRVLKPGGRLVVGEGQPDPHMVSLHALSAIMELAGLRYERHVGGRLGYLARFRAP